MSTNGHNIVAPYIATVKVKVIVGIWRASSSTDEDVRFVLSRALTGLEPVFRGTNSDKGMSQGERHAVYYLVS
jgi:hypothetical protein